MGHLSRQPNSNDPPVGTSNPWGSRNPELVDDMTVLLNGDGERCCVCQRVILNCYLKTKDGKNYCPNHAPTGARKLPAIHKEERHYGASAGDGEAD